MSRHWCSCSEAAGALYCTALSASVEALTAVSLLLVGMEEGGKSPFSAPSSGELLCVPVTHPCFTACLVCEALLSDELMKKPKNRPFPLWGWSLPLTSAKHRPSLKTGFKIISDWNLSKSSWFQVSSEQEAAEEAFLPLSVSDFTSIRGIPANIWSSLRWKEVKQHFHLTICTQWEDPKFIWKRCLQNNNGNHNWKNVEYLEIWLIYHPHWANNQ